MDISNEQGMSQPSPARDAVAPPEITKTSNASTLNSTTNSMTKFLFSKRGHHNSGKVDIELTQTQFYNTNAEHDGAEALTPDGKGMNSQIVLSNPDIVENRKEDIGAVNPTTGGKKTPLSMPSFPNFNSWVQPHKDMVGRKANLWYKKYIFRGILRQREISPTKDGRHIDLDASRKISLVDERSGKEYMNNTIRSSRYTIWSFLPYQLWFQFSKVANFFFLVTGIVQLIPGLSTTGTYATILPLVFFLSFSIAREGYDDFRRYQLDKVENRRQVSVLYGYRPGGIEKQTRLSFTNIVQQSWNSLKRNVRRGSKEDSTEIRSVLPERKDMPQIEISAESGDSGPSPWAIVKWMDLKVGDTIELNRDDQVPADIVLLHADGRNGMAYIETMALDGETNLKSRQPPHLLAKCCGTLTGLSSCHAHFVVEDPNLDLYEFNGKVSSDDETVPLTLNNIVYRGSTLRNTTRVVGMVINTGEECKIRMNASRNPQAKAPVIQAMTNRIVILLSVLLILLSIGCTVGYVIWTKVYEDNAWYLAGANVPLDDIFIAFAIEFNNLIPLALYVSLEIVKFAQFLLLCDVEMYDPVSDTPMVANTQTIIENLGQVNYIFSDKTGTLTENVMRFRKMDIAGTVWQHNVDIHKQGVRKAGDERDVIMAKRTEQETTEQGVHPGLSTTESSTHLPLDLQGSSSVTLRMESTVSPLVSQLERCTDELLKYLQYRPNTVFAQKARLFLLSLAICHTCYPEVQKDGEIAFQAASPDELALVEAAKDLGYIVIDRRTQSITLLTYPSGPDSALRETYEVLDIIEFSSKRKRMSVIVRFPSGKICVFCKGADSVIQPRFKLASSVLQKTSQVESRQSRPISDEAEQALLWSSHENEPKSRLHKANLIPDRPSLDRKTIGSGQISISSIDLDPIDLKICSNLCDREIHVHSDAYKTIQTSIEKDPSHLHTLLESKISKQASYFHDLIDDDQFLDEANLLSGCLEHMNQFASEGLRTLIYGYRFIDNEEYTTWKKTYHQATTSLVRRQEMVESAGEMIEQNFELAGATAIEDKLQKGVPETIDKLQRANIKIWMLTGDKRETAINIAHSARICKNYSRVIILDHENDALEQHIASSLLEITSGRSGGVACGIAHNVVVVNGQTLAEIEGKEKLGGLFYDLLLQVDSVICCRASPSQKAAVVKAVRHKVRGSITLAIGDGGNDIAMIQEAHVGVGISGKEGLQAARVADYSIAQFRFLQRLLLVHGHWNYVRTAKYILLTFWKEMIFYSVQVMYQRWNGYTGTSLYESDSLTVWNTLFTSLPVMLPGIFEQDLSAATLLAVPELYSYGQESKGFNMKKYGLWMIMAAWQSQVIYFMVYGLYGMIPIASDQGLFAIGDLAFSVCVVFINFKLLILQYHYKTWIPIFGAILTIFGWWAWNLFLSAIYYNCSSPYAVYQAFIQHFGKDLTWWTVLAVILAVVIIPELVIDTLKRRFWPSMSDIWQELEQDKSIRRRLEVSGGEGGYSVR